MYTVASRLRVYTSLAFPLRLRRVTPPLENGVKTNDIKRNKGDTMSLDKGGREAAAAAVAVWGGAARNGSTLTNRDKQTVCLDCGGGLY